MERFARRSYWRNSTIFFEITLVSNVESPKDDAYLDQVKNLCAEFHPVPWKEVSKYSFKFYLKAIAWNVFSLSVHGDQ